MGLVDRDEERFSGGSTPLRLPPLPILAFPAYRVLCVAGSVVVCGWVALVISYNVSYLLLGQTNGVTKHRLAHSIRTLHACVIIVVKAS